MSTRFTSRVDLVRWLNSGLCFTSHVEDVVYELSLYQCPTRGDRANSDSVGSSIPYMYGYPTVSTCTDVALESILHSWIPQ
jgi:hypothetical protein